MKDRDRHVQLALSSLCTAVLDKLSSLLIEASKFDEKHLPGPKL